MSDLDEKIIRQIEVNKIFTISIFKPTFSLFFKQIKQNKKVLLWRHQSQQRQIHEGRNTERFRM
jgi:hypothetical protein